MVYITQQEDDEQSTQRTRSIVGTGGGQLAVTFGEGAIGTNHAHRGRNEVSFSLEQSKTKQN